jgi:hypothetical protein
MNTPPRPAAVRSRPVIFTAAEVRATQQERKSQFRRPVKLREFQPSETLGYDWTFRDRRGCWNDYTTEELIARVCPFSRPDDRLWVRETFRAIFDPGARKSEIRRWGRDDFGRIPIVVDYRADNPQRIMDRIGKPEWKPPVCQPRWASRLTLEVTAVRVQRIQEISHEDALAEGCAGCNWVARSPYIIGPHTDDGELPQEEFAQVWDETHGRRPGCSWEASPWCWCVSYRKESC